MEARLYQIETKPNDYKICKACHSINWYENETCHNYDYKKFDTEEGEIQNWVNEEKEYWMDEEGYTEEEADATIHDI